MDQRVLLSILFVCAFFIDYSTSAKTENVFYVLGGDGIYVIDPVAKSIVMKITNTTSPGLCTQSNNTYSSRNPCSFGQARVVDDSVFVADASGSAVHVIDIKTQKKVETIPTDPHPFGLHFLPWLQEAWVHSWNLSTFDVIDTENRTRIHNAIRAHVKPGFTHGIMLAHKKMLGGKIGYVTHFSNPGIHKLNLETKTYSGFLNFTDENCTGTYSIAYNSYNNRLYVDCQRRYRSISVLEINVANDKIVKTWNFPGDPFVSPDGRYVVVLHRSKSESRMNILAVTGSKVAHYPELLITGGVSHTVFYPKGNNPGSYYAFVTLDYSNKMAVVDMDLAKNGNVSDVKYIEDVDELDITSHGSSRDLFIHEKWIISPATKSKTAVIINAETQKVHGKVSGVNLGGFAVWVGAATTSSTSATTSSTSATTSSTSATMSGTSATTSGTSSTTSGTSGVGNPNFFMGFLIFFYVFLQV